MDGNWTHIQRALGKNTYDKLIIHLFNAHLKSHTDHHPPQKKIKINETYKKFIKNEFVLMSIAQVVGTLHYVGAQFRI